MTRLYISPFLYLCLSVCLVTPMCIYVFTCIWSEIMPPIPIFTTVDTLSDLLFFYSNSLEMATAYNQLIP